MECSKQSEHVVLDVEQATLAYVDVALDGTSDDMVMSSV